MIQIRFNEEAKSPSQQIIWTVTQPDKFYDMDTIVTLLPDYHQYSIFSVLDITQKEFLGNSILSSYVRTNRTTNPLATDYHYYSFEMYHWSLSNWIVDFGPAPN